MEHVITYRPSGIWPDEAIFRSDSHYYWFRMFSGAIDPADHTISPFVTVYRGGALVSSSGRLSVWQDDKTPCFEPWKCFFLTARTSRRDWAEIVANPVGWMLRTVL